MRQKGFTLLEVLIALVIASLALSSIYGLVLTGFGTADLSARQAHALAIARSRLAIVDLPNAAGAGVFEGDEKGGYHWVLSITPAAVPPRTGGAPPLILYDVRIDVRWPAGAAHQRAVTLETRRTGPPPP